MNINYDISFEFSDLERKTLEEKYPSDKFTWVKFKNIEDEEFQIYVFEKEDKPYKFYPYDFKLDARPNKKCKLPEIIATTRYKVSEYEICNKDIKL